MSIELSTEKFDQLMLLKSSLSKYNYLNEVYVFGSFLESKNRPNDIDILIIYDDINPNFKNNILNLRSDIYSITGLIADVTAMTLIENREINFLIRLNNNYLKIK